MKLRSSLKTALLATATTVALCAQETAPAPAAATPAVPAVKAPAPQFTDAQVLETLGWLVGRQAQLAPFDFKGEEIDQIIAGFRKSMAGEEAPYGLDEIGTRFQSYMQTRQQTAMTAMAKKAKDEGAAVLAKVKEQPGVVTLPSGLMYEILKEGSGETPKATDTVKVNYTGTLTDGTVFDSSESHGGPAEFPLDHVIPGWTEGLQHVSKGGKIKLYVPSDLGYGDGGTQGIPPGSTLIFEVELLEINPPAAGGSDAGSSGTSVTTPPIEVPAAQ